MKILVHSSPTTLQKWKTDNLGILSSPRRFYKNVEGWSWAADNDAFNSWDERLFVKMLDKISELSGCLFVSSPDVVGDAEKTIELFLKWEKEIHGRGLPVAFVGQDGITGGDDERIPWDNLDAIFIGGTTEFKLGEEAKSLALEAKKRNKWLHMGRVNSMKRILYAKGIGCDSVDGSHYSRFKNCCLDKSLEIAKRRI